MDESTKPDPANQRWAPVWTPTPGQIQSTNVAHWMLEQGIGDYQSFYRWSVDSRAEFWQSAISRLGISFDKNPTTVLNVDDGEEHAKWCAGGKLNIVKSCFQGDDHETAIIAQQPTGELRRTTNSQLRAMANRISNSLVAHGCRKGDAVAVVLPMTELSVAIYLGIVQAGCIVVSIADSFAPPQICLLYTSPSPRDKRQSRMPSSA